MGAIIIHFSLPGTLTPQRVRHAFQRRRKEDFKKRHRYTADEIKRWDINPYHVERWTSPYTPDFYSAKRLDVYREEHFTKKSDAIEFAHQRAEKWTNFVAVRYGNGKRMRWLVCGLGPI